MGSAQNNKFAVSVEFFFSWSLDGPVEYAENANSQDATNILARANVI
jgi:hypothetical protein